MKKYPLRKQGHSRLCGPLCIAMIADYYGIHLKLDISQTRFNISKKGVSLLELKKMAENLGLYSEAMKIEYISLKERIMLPTIAHWYNKHYIVVYRILYNSVFIADPAIGMIEYTKEEFLKGWAGEANGGIVLNIRPIN